MSDTSPRTGTGTLLVISAPSGGGKTSLVQALTASLENLVVSVSHTTRPRRGGETDGVAYHFVDDGSFEQMVRNDEFLEYATVFDHRYGTSRPAIEQRLEQNIDVILEIDWQGARSVRDSGLDTVSIFILPPSIEVLEERLRGRGDSEAVVERRMRDAVAEMSHYDEYDYLVVNDNFGDAVNDLKSIICSVRLARQRQQHRYAALLRSLVAS